MEQDLTFINEKIGEESQIIERILSEMEKVIVGQRPLLERMMVALLCSGHILLEGVPGLAKTLLIKTVAEAIDADFSRLQFTPDLLPADLIGTQIYNPKSGEFTVHQGPLFANLVLADEVNRAPGKVQSALLEAMQERQITIGSQTYTLPELFLVLATQNPIEQEGTYPLPEAQVDRFMLKVMVDYPQRVEERMIVDRMTGVSLPQVRRLDALPGVPQTQWEPLLVHSFGDLQPLRPSDRVLNIVSVFAPRSIRWLGAFCV